MFSFTTVLLLLIATISGSEILNCDSIYIRERCIEVTDNCEKCLVEHPCCSWCYDKDFTKPRCNTKNQLTANNCTSENLIDVHSSLDIIENKDYTILKESGEDAEAVQIMPQKLKVKLKYGDSVTFQVKYKAAENYPLDLYFLVDFTHSMQHYLKAIQKLGTEMSTFLKKLTTTYKLGLGFYADKVSMPYAYTDEKNLENPCSETGTVCEKLFDFRHNLNFTNNIHDFLEHVAVERTTANVDDLEGGFDALMQVLACGEQMEWRKFSRKIVVFAIAGFPMHTAGDGILGGATIKNPGKCFLDSSGEYTKSLLYDYPSLEEIYHKLEEKKINVLFAIISKTDYYKKITEVIPDFTNVGFLSDDSTNILEIIEEAYSKVVKNLKFVPYQNRTSFVTISSESSCNKPEYSYQWNETFSCDNVVPGEEFIFNMTLRLTRPPPSTLKGEVITIQEQNIHENLIIEVEYVGTECKCTDTNSGNVCDNGFFKCGICNCEDGWGGVQCEKECSEDLCRFDNGTYLSTPCFGQGICSREACGCVCNHLHSGRYCQHPQCPRHNGKICAGPQHGICVEGECQCLEGFTGRDCSCPTSQDTCTAHGKVCNDVGKCICGKCVCETVDGVKYSGTYCEWCPECQGFCDKYAECVVADIEGKSDLCSANVSPMLVKELGSDKNLCSHRFYKGDETCQATFQYKKNSSIVDLKYTQECWRPVGAGFISGLVIALILGLGILLIIIYKVKIMVQDKKEVAEFEKLKAREQFGMNPLYNSPVVNYEVPDELRYKGD